jgi:hypothetical protein
MNPPVPAGCSCWDEDGPSTWGRRPDGPPPTAPCLSSWWSVRLWMPKTTRSVRRCVWRPSFRSGSMPHSPQRHKTLRRSWAGQTRSPSSRAAANGRGLNALWSQTGGPRIVQPRPDRRHKEAAESKHCEAHETMRRGASLYPPHPEPRTGGDEPHALHRPPTPTSRPRHERRATPRRTGRPGRTH